MQKTMAMKPAYVLTRPYTLDFGKEYYLRVRQDSGIYPTYFPVRFTNYDPCPALVVVDKGDGQLWRVPRDDIFTAEVTICD